MNMAGNKTNDFYAQLEPYVDFSQGAVSSRNELLYPFRSCQRLTITATASKSAPFPQEQARTYLWKSSFMSRLHL